jgi:alcohol dehydrogenase class IV
VTAAFRHTDRDQTIVFGPGAVERSTDLLGDRYTLLTTARAAAATPGVAARAAAVVDVPLGAVPPLAAQLRPAINGERIVALGGGRVIDTAKAIAAADGLPGPVAIPTSLSGAEMTGVHRHALDVPADRPCSRASIVINDPTLSASQPEDRLAASSANAMGHGLTALVSTISSPIARSVALDAVGRLARAWSSDGPDRPELALGALLAGWAVDRSGLGPHHALCQTAVREASLGHAYANAALLPYTTRAYRSRAPERFADLEAETGIAPEALADLLRERAGAEGLGPMGRDGDLLGRIVETASGRPELGRVPPPLSRAEVREIYLDASRHATGAG